MHACGTLAEADAALDGEGAQRFELIVLDRDLPDGDSLVWLVGMRQRDLVTPTLVLTARDRVADRMQGLQSGADDYLVKPITVEELDVRVEVLARRAQALRGELIHFGRLSWLGREGRAFVDERVLDLTPREFEVLGVLVLRAPRLVLTRSLTDALAERNIDLGESAADIYVSRLRRKLEGSGASICTMRGFGYLITLDADADVA